MRNIVLIAILSLLPFVAGAENLELKYEASWVGIKAGEARVVFTENTGVYNGEAKVSSLGLVRRLTNYWSDSLVKGALKNGKYTPEQYDSKWQPKKLADGQRVVVSYGKNGEVSEVATPAENRGKRPEVVQKDKQGLPDPITAGIMAREKVREIIKSGATLPQSFSMKIFDSRRVTELNFKIAGYEEKKVNGEKQKLLQIIFNRNPVAGYNKKELDKMKEVNPLINIYVNEQFIPVYATGQSIIGEITIKLVKSPSAEQGAN